MGLLPASAQPAQRPIFFRPMIVVAVAVMAGIAIGVYLPGHFKKVLGLACGLGVVVGIQTLRRRPALVWPIVFCAAFGYASIHPWLRSDLPPGHVVHFVDQGRWQIRGTVADPPIDSPERGRFVLEALQLERGPNSHPVTGKVAVSTLGPLPELTRGDTVMVSGHLRSIRSFCNPGGFDYERFMLLQGIRTRLFTQGQEVRRLASPPQGWRSQLDRLRRLLLLRMESTLQGYSPDAIAILKALTLGERADIGAVLQTAFNRSGVTHVLSISGLHIGMVALVGFATGFRLLVWIPFFLRRGWVHRGAALVSLVPVLVYGLLSGLSAATQRSMLMTAVFLLSYWVGRRHDWLNTLAIAALVIVVIYPPALVSVSFQLSFAAVLAMMMGLRAFAVGRPDSSTAVWRRWLARVQASLWVSVLAILGTLPLVLRYFNLLPVFGPLTNLVVVPLTGMVVVPAGLLGVICLPLSPLLAGWCWKAAALCLVPQCWLIEKVAACPWAAVNTVTPSGWEMLLFYLLFGLLLYWKQCGRWRVVALALMVVAAATDTGYWIYQRYGRSTMAVTVVDVGQGSANIVELPHGFTVVIDGGGFGDNSVFDTGQRILAPLLWRKKIKTIDLMVLTHPDSDHLNGLIYLLDHFSIGQIWSTQQPVDSTGFHRWIETIAELGIEHVSFATLTPRFEKNGAVVEVLGPIRDFSQHLEAPWRDTNNSSMVVRISLGQVSVFFPGDIMTRAEEELVQRYPESQLASTVLVVPHHGSRTSCSSRLLEAVQPAEAVISVGWQNRFGFPHSAVLKRLATVGSRIWRTDRCGAIQLQTDGHAYTVRTCRQVCP